MRRLEAGRSAIDDYAARVSAADRVPAPVLVLGAIVSVQFGGALAATLIPRIGAAGSVALRLIFASAILLVIVRPRLRGYRPAQWRTVVLFGIALGLMNFTFYASLAHLPLGVAVTTESDRDAAVVVVAGGDVVDAVGAALVWFEEAIGVVDRD